MDDYELDLYVPSYRLPCLSRRIAYGLGHVLNDFGRTLWFNFLLVYFVSVLNLQPDHTGYIILVGQITSVLATIFFDFIGSRKNACCCWYTKRKSWHIYGTILTIVSTLLLYMKCVGCSTDSSGLQAIYYGAFAVVFHIGWSAVQSSHLAMIPEITRNLNERIELGAIRYSIGIVANILVFAVLWVLFYLSKHADLSSKDANLFQILAISLTVAGVVASFFFHLGTDEHGYDMFLEAHLSTVSFDRMTWRHWLCQPHFYLISVIHTCLRLSINVATIYLPLYTMYTLQLHKVYIVALPLAAYLGKTFFPLATRPLARCSTPKLTLILGSLLVIGSGVWAWFIQTSWPMFELQAIFLSIFLGAGGSVACVSAFDIIRKIIGDKTETSAFIYGTLTALDKIFTGIVIMLIQVLYQQFNSKIAQDGIDYYRGVFAVAACLAALALLFHIVIVPMRLGVPRDRGEIFTATSSTNGQEITDECSMKTFEKTASEDCFNFWSCLSTSNETESHFIAFTYTTNVPTRDTIVPSLSGSIGDLGSPYTTSVFETNRRSYSYESIEAMRAGSSMRSVQSLPNVIEYSGNHEGRSNVVKRYTPTTATSSKDTAGLVENEELPESTSSPNTVNDTGANVVSRNGDVIVHSTQNANVEQTDGILVDKNGQPNK